MANIAGSGAGVTAVAGVNTLDNNVNAKIENSTVHNGNANVKAENNTKANTMVVAASGAGVGAASKCSNNNRCGIRFYNCFN